MRANSLLLVVLALWASTAAAVTAKDCESNELAGSNLACLTIEYREASRLLESKVEQLVKNATTVPLSVQSGSQTSTIKSIRAAARGWKQAMEAECGVLLVTTYGTGSGAEPAGMNCRITRTYERIKYLSKAEEYEWLWER
jgi:uncharacterized protein YecT (DUF1311 family)